MLSTAFPVFETVVVRVALLPTGTEPKLSDAGETPIFGAGGAVPVPESETNTIRLNGSSVISTSCVSWSPLLVGLKRTTTSILDSARTLKGAGVVEVNDGDKVVIDVTFKGVVPVLLTVNDLVADAPTCTDPKAITEGFTRIEGSEADPWLMVNVSCAAVIVPVRAAPGLRSS